MKLAQSLEGAVRSDMHCAQPGHVRAGQREGARQERPMAGVSHHFRQLRTQLLARVKGRRGVAGTRFYGRLMSDETFGDAAHLCRGTAHDLQLFISAYLKCSPEIAVSTLPYLLSSLTPWAEMTSRLAR